MAPLLYALCGLLLALLALRRHRFIPTVVIGFDIGAALSVAQQPEIEWAGYALAINGLGAACMALAAAESKLRQRLEARRAERLEVRERIFKEQREIDAQVAELEARLHIQKDLYQSARGLAAVLSMDSFLHEVRASVAGSFTYQSGWLIQFPRGGASVVRDLHNAAAGDRAPFDEEFLEMLRTCRDVLLSTDEICSLAAREAPSPSASWIAAPLMHQGATWGAIVWLDVEWARDRPGRGVVELVEMLRNLQYQFSLALSRILLYEQTEKLSRTDPLTDLHKRWYFMQRLEEEVLRCRRNKAPLSVIMIDIDHFKRINDRFGHLAGDRVLHAVAQRVRETLRLGDLACRYGGEEFLIALPGADEEQAAQAAERIREAIRDLSIDTSGEPARVTASLGVAQLLEPQEHVEDAIDRADSMLYRAKWLGRDRVCVFGREAWDAGASDGV